MKTMTLLLPMILTFLLSPQAISAAEPAAPTVIVLSSGEPLLAGSVEAFVEKQLAKRGFDVVDESGIPGLRAWLDGRVSREEEDRVLQALSERAAHGLVIEAAYLGERPLYYLYRSEPIFQARLKIRSLPFDADGVPKALFDERIEFTHLSLDREIEKVLGRPLREIADHLAGHSKPTP